jgi:hypothetical protein
MDDIQETVRIFLLNFGINLLGVLIFAQFSFAVIKKIKIVSVSAIS